MLETFLQYSLYIVFSLTMLFLFFYKSIQSKQMEKEDSLMERYMMYKRRITRYER